MLDLNTKLEVTPLLAPENPNKPSAVIGGKTSGILNWNDIKYDLAYERYKELLANFWIASEINMTDDIKQWKQFTEEEKERFLKINGLVSILDSVQPRFFGHLIKYISDPSIQNVFIIAMQQEVVHNQSYSYILSSLERLENQNKAFDMARSEKAIYERNNLIINVYDELDKNPTVKTFLNALIASVALEGINFYSAFAYFYNLARNQKMLKTSTLVSYIQKDELVHTKIVTDVINLIVKENPHLHSYIEEFSKEFLHMAVEKEIEWSTYILKGEEDIDLLEMADYIKYRANKCLSMIGIPALYEEVGDNPMPWIRAFSDENMNAGKTDFFENKPRSYTKISEDNGFDEL